MLLDFTIGRKGLLGYLKALAGSNIVKVVPASVDASGAQVNGHKKLKVVCGANTSYLDDLAWIGDKTPMTIADVRVSPDNAVKPNIGSLELSEALNRVLPFTARDDNRPVLQCVLFTAREGKLKLVSADGFRLAVVTLDYDGEGQALISRDDLKSVTNALRRAKRARISFEPSGSLDSKNLVLDTELIRYKWNGVNGTYPDWQKLIPTEFKVTAHLDAIEALKALQSLKAIADNPKAYPIDITIGDGKIVMANPDDKAQAEVKADADGEMYIRVDGTYLAQVLKAFGGMVDFRLSSPTSPMLFSADGYQVVVMPMVSEKAKEYEAKRQAETTATTEAQPAEAVTDEEGEGVAGEPTDEEAEKPKRKRKAKEPVTVA